MYTHNDYNEIFIVNIKFLLAIAFGFPCDEIWTYEIGTVDTTQYYIWTSTPIGLSKLIFREKCDYKNAISILNWICFVLK